jgi:hypothetical protein
MDTLFHILESDRIFDHQMSEAFLQSFSTKVECCNLFREDTIAHHIYNGYE